MSIAMADKPSGHRARLTPGLELVFALVREGKTNKEIALIRGVSEQAIKRQVSTLFRHYGVDTRAALIAAAYQQELDLLRSQVGPMTNAYEDGTGGHIEPPSDPAYPV